jgi:hypothetical protein
MAEERHGRSMLCVNLPLYSNEKKGLQQFQMESCQPIKRLKDKKKT